MEINKYTTYCRGLKDHEEYCLPDDVNKLISYHKAVVKTMQNKIDELEKLKNCSNCIHYAVSLETCCKSKKHMRCDPDYVCSKWTAKGIK